MFDILEKLWSTEGLLISQTYSADQKLPYANFKVVLMHQALYKLHEISHKSQQRILLLQYIFLG